MLRLFLRYHGKILLFAADTTGHIICSKQYGRASAQFRCAVTALGICVRTEQQFYYIIYDKMHYISGSKHYIGTITVEIKINQNRNICFLSQKGGC